MVFKKGIYIFTALMKLISRHIILIHILLLHGGRDENGMP